ncbi:MAG TPA: hypothetical protein PLK27_02630, partial [Neisseria sp.]|nr:hypothetical protein [Neisseria sp.]
VARRACRRYRSAAVSWRQAYQRPSETFSTAKRFRRPLFDYLLANFAQCISILPSCFDLIASSIYSIKNNISFKGRLNTFQLSQLQKNNVY